MPKTKIRTITAVDLFCGAGGATRALLEACKDRGLKLSITGINHWPLAIETHSKNHDYAGHVCADINEVNPLAIVPGGKLDILLAGIECIFFSTARGGKVVNDQRRSTGWKVLEWCEKLHVRTVIIENVPEFVNWGPLYLTGPNKDRPIPSKRGKIFLAFVNALRALGYTVDWKVLNAANYGDPTTRERFFLVATRGNHRPVFPDPTHGKDVRRDMFGRRLKPWRAVKEIIDWDDKGTSIFNRELYGKRPLSENTMRRIFAGLEKFCGLSFVLPPLGYHARNGKANSPRSVEQPLQTVTSRGGGHVIQPFLVKLHGTSNAASIDAPAPTILAGGHHLAVVEPFVIPQQSGAAPRNAREPLPTVSGAGAIGLVEPFLISLEHMGQGNDKRVHSSRKPMPTLTAKSDFGVVQPFIMTLEHTTGNGKRKENGQRCYPASEPMPTLTNSNTWAMVQPFLVEYYGTAGAESIDDPLNTVTTKDRHALVVPEWAKDLKPGYKLLYIPGVGLLDVRHRMLRPRECARAHSFPNTYTFLGNQDDQMRMIGNSWPVKMGAAVCGAQIDAMLPARKAKRNSKRR